MTRSKHDLHAVARYLRSLLQVDSHAQEHEALRRSERRNEALLHALPDMMFILDQNNVVVEQLGRTRSAVDGQTLNHVGRAMTDILPPDVAEKSQYHLRLLRTSGEMQTFENTFDDDHFFETRLVKLPDETVLVIMRDITERRRAEQQLYQLAFYDPLTGLPNREQFKRRLDEAIKEARLNPRTMALLHIDLDRFNRINETLGRSVGDELLKSVSKRLSSSVRTNRVSNSEGSAAPGGDLLARLGGDEFGLLISDVGAESNAEALAERVRAMLSASYVYQHHRFVITPSIGVALFPSHARTAEELLKHADSALFRAKASGRNCSRLFSTGMAHRSLERLELEYDIRAALKNNEFLLFYQPKVDLATWTIVGAEALLRWPHPKRGWVSPSEFVPIAEEAGVIGSLGQWVLREACRQLREWQSRGLAIKVAINVSSEEFCEANYAARLLATVEKCGIRTSSLELEITEGLLMRNVEGTRETLKRLGDAGLSLSVDDFGTGYSSLSYLQDFPLHSLKIDQTFIRDLHKSKDRAAIVSAILAMARELGLTVIAEGVETEEQLQYLRRHHCDQIQGFYFSKPLPAQEFEALLLNSREDPRRVSGAFNAS